MATSVADICNLALLRVGVKLTIDSLDEVSAEAAACKAVYAQSRDFVLEAMPWPFAKRSAVLAALVVPARADWGFTYALPADCVAPRHIWNGLNEPSPDNVIPFEIESAADMNTSILLCNERDAELVYTAAVTNPTRFAPAFVDALAWQVAAEVVAPLTGKAERERVYRANAMMAISGAAAKAMNQQQRGTQPDSPAIRIRG